MRSLYEPFKIATVGNISKGLQIYHKLLEDMFNYESYTYAAHAHLHLVDQCLLHGPLYLFIYYTQKIKRRSLCKKILLQFECSIENIKILEIKKRRK